MNPKPFAAKFYLTGLLVLASGLSPVSSAEEAGPSRVPRSPEWIRSSVIYQVYLRDFSEEGKFHNLENDLSKLKNLGVNCIDLLPIHPAGSAAGGALGNPMNVKDFNAVSLENGTRDGFKSFVEQVHFNEMKVILDWVLDRAASEAGIVKEHPDWFLSGEKSGESDSVFFNFKSEPLRKYLLETLKGWLRDYDFDGYRFVGMENVPSSFLDEVKLELFNLKPGALILADHGAPEANGSAHGVLDLNFYGLISNAAMGQVPASQIQEILDEDAKRTNLWPVSVRFIESFEKPRAAQLLGPAALPAAALLFSLDGVPLILSGQEIAETKQPSPIVKSVIKWEEDGKKNSEVRKFYKKIIALRAKHPALARGQKFPIRAGGGGSAFVFASSFRDDAVLVAVNFSANPFEGVLDLPEIFLSVGGKINLKPVFLTGTLSQLNANVASLKLPAWGCQIWEMK